MVASPRQLALLGCLASSIFLGHGASLQQDPSPVSRVIALLGKLEAQITEEGKKEAAEYDKFACYCKEKADDTQYAIEKSTEKIKVLKAAIEKLEAEIKDLEADIEELKATIEEKEKAIKKAEEKRKTEHEAYVKEAEEVAEAITALEEAIEVLKDSKKEMKEAKLDLLQDKLLKALTLGGASPSELQIDAIQSLSQAPPKNPGRPPAYEYQSNDIIATLEKLKAEFKENKKEINVAEKDKLFAFEEKKQALENEKAFAEKDKTEKEAIVEEKKKEKAEKTKDKEEEEKDLKADESFMDDITTECQSKAEEWDQRSKVRSEELTAIAEAIAHLKEGVKPNYGANQLAAGASFLQLRRGAGSSAAAVLGRAVDFLGGEATRLHSATLSGLALKLKLKSGGHFANIEKLIEDLIKKLEDEAKLEADSKTFCDKGMTKAVEKRDKNKLDMEDAEATIAMKEAEKVKLTGEIKETSKEIAELQKALLEATELRSEEKATNEKTLEESEAGKKAVDQAILVLQDFYSANAFLQKKGPNRDGDTVEDTAPKLSYSGDYKGKQEASKGIIGILEMIAADFEKTISETKEAETTAQTDFETFEKDTKDDIKEKTEMNSDKEDAIVEADAAIVEAKDSLESGEKLLEKAMKDLEKLKAMCLTGEGTFAERKKQREEEIKALKAAKQILADWKDF